MVKLVKERGVEKKPTIYINWKAKKDLGLGGGNEQMLKKDGSGLFDIIQEEVVSGLGHQ
jgi:hypothetical protein